MSGAVSLLHFASVMLHVCAFEAAEIQNIILYDWLLVSHLMSWPMAVSCRTVGSGPQFILWKSTRCSRLGNLVRAPSREKALRPS